MFHRRFFTIVLFLVMSSFFSFSVSLSLGDIVDRLAVSQDRSSWFRDRCVYYQKIHVKRYKKSLNNGFFGLFAEKESVAEVYPLESGEVVARLISDTDNHMKPKKVKGKRKLIFGAPAFLERIFFPFYPENVKYYDVVDLGNVFVEDFNGKKMEVRAIKIVPGVKKAPIPLVEGIFYLDPDKGYPIRLNIDRLYFLHTLDKKLKKLYDFTSDIFYKRYFSKFSLPYRAKGKGNSRIIRYKGYFEFSFEEWGYKPSPLYPEVKKYFQKVEEK